MILGWIRVRLDDAPHEVKVDAVIWSRGEEPFCSCASALAGNKPLSGGEPERVGDLLGVDCLRHRNGIGDKGRLLLSYDRGFEELDGYIGRIDLTLGWHTLH